jgi:hypothetical protein
MKLIEFTDEQLEDELKRRRTPVVRDPLPMDQRDFTKVGEITISLVNWMVETGNGDATGHMFNDCIEDLVLEAVYGKGIHDELLKVTT